jgi:hypothetical protein
METLERGASEVAGKERKAGIKMTMRGSAFKRAETNLALCLLR